MLSTSVDKVLRTRQAESTDCSRGSSDELCRRCNGRSLSGPATAAYSQQYSSLLQQQTSKNNIATILSYGGPIRCSKQSFLVLGLILVLVSVLIAISF